MIVDTIVANVTTVPALLTLWRLFNDCREKIIVSPDNCVILKGVSMKGWIVVLKLVSINVEYRLAVET